MWASRLRRRGWWLRASPSRPFRSTWPRPPPVEPWPRTALAYYATPHRCDRGHAAGIDAHRLGRAWEENGRPLEQDHQAVDLKSTGALLGGQGCAAVDAGAEGWAHYFPAGLSLAASDAAGTSAAYNAAKAGINGLRHRAERTGRGSGRARQRDSRQARRAQGSRCRIQSAAPIRRFILWAKVGPRPSSPLASTF